MGFILLLIFIMELKVRFKQMVIKKKRFSQVKIQKDSGEKRNFHK